MIAAAGTNQTKHRGAPRISQRGRGEELHASCVSPGVWATAVPFPSVLGYSFSYCVRVPQGVVIVDLGWDSDDAWRLFVAGLGRAGASLDEIIGVVATHVHPDHYGLAGRIKANTEAWIACHANEARYIVACEDRNAWRAELTQWLDRCGVPRGDGLLSEVQRLVESMVSVPPDFVLRDGDVIPGTDGVLSAVHTPGHTAGSLCFHDRSRRLLFTGDHLLPRVTPNVSKRPRSTEDPLRDFLHSLAVLHGLADSAEMVLPGHEWPFDRMSERVSALTDHHADRLDEIEAAVALGASTVWEVAHAVGWSRRFEEFDARAQRQALGETYAHLFRLESAGRLVLRHGADETGPLEWAAAQR
jgi:glyoxylase-like metal-dependent hydrolase (beta-lactamase superfamily II)